MRHERNRCAGFVMALLLSGCASAAPSPVLPLGTEHVAFVPSADSSAVTALGALADNPILRLAVKDADDTLAWVESQKATLGPLKTFRASQCPMAVKLAAGDLREKVMALQGRLRALEARVEEGPKAPEVILTLTKLKFGDPVDPQAAIGQLKDDVVNRLAAVTTSCAGLFPAKQFRELAGLAARAGLIASPLAPLSGFLP